MANYDSKYFALRIFKVSKVKPKAPARSKALVRTDYKKKPFDPAAMEAAVRKVTEGEPLRKVVRETGLNRNTIRKFLRKLKDNPNLKQFGPMYGCHKRTFSEPEEEQLFEYLQQASRMHGGLTRSQTIELGYVFAKSHGREVTNLSGTLGKKWFASFIRRHPTLPIREDDGKVAQHAPLPKVLAPKARSRVEKAVVLVCTPEVPDLACTKPEDAN